MFLSRDDRVTGRPEFLTGSAQINPFSIIFKLISVQVQAPGWQISFCVY